MPGLVPFALESHGSSRRDGECARSGRELASLAGGFIAGVPSGGHIDARQSHGDECGVRGRPFFFFVRSGSGGPAANRLVASVGWSGSGSTNFSSSCCVWDCRVNVIVGAPAFVNHDPAGRDDAACKTTAVAPAQPAQSHVRPPIRQRQPRRQPKSRTTLGMDHKLQRQVLFSASGHRLSRERHGGTSASAVAHARARAVADDCPFSELVACRTLRSRRVRALCPSKAQRSRIVVSIESHAPSLRHDGGRGVQDGERGRRRVSAPGHERRRQQGAVSGRRAGNG